MREFVLFCDLAKDHCPTKKEAPGVSRSFALAGFLWRSGSATHWLSLGQRTRLTLRALVSGGRSEHIRRPVIARIARVQAAAQKSWIAADFPFQSKRLPPASRDLR
jgi:hypothetical protein